MLAKLIGACALAMALSAVQMLPSLEFSGQSWRAAGITASNVYRYSIHPCRVIELIWPNVYGTLSRESLLASGRPARGRPRDRDGRAVHGRRCWSWP